MEFHSPLRYPGGKGKVATYIHKLFEKNLLCDGYYVEPYAGGASVALSLLINEYAKKILINDIDKSIYSFWHSVLHYTDQLCKLIHDTKVDMKQWHRQKEIQANKSHVSHLELGFSTFFLNRTNRSGILSAGVIGGKEQAGEWKMDARYNKIDLITRIERISRYKDRIDIYNQDAYTLINNLKTVLPHNTLIYFDPPYYVKGRDLYINFYEHKDHKKISKMISKVTNQKWIVSYDNVPDVRDLYKSYRQLIYSLKYSAAGASTGSEVMIFSNNLYMLSDSPNCFPQF